MALAIGRKADQVRVLSDLSGLVVGALVDDTDHTKEGDPFTDALRRYREEGAPSIYLWRSVAAGISNEAHTAEVLRHLTRDLLKRVSMPEESDDAEGDTVAEAAPQNVRPIDAPHDVPALELASDGTWKPSGSSLASQEEVDANTLRRSVPSVRSRYPQLAHDERLVLPPAPKRFTEVTAQPAPAVPAVPSVNSAAVIEATPPVVIEEQTAVAPASAPATMEDDAAVVSPAPAPEPIARAPVVDRESVIKAVAGGIEVVAGPFARFQQLAAFVKALRALSGVQDVTTRQFVRGMVHLRVRHSQTISLADRLLELAEFQPTIVSSTQDRIELKVDIAE